MYLWNPHVLLFENQWTECEHITTFQPPKRENISGECSPGSGPARTAQSMKTVTSGVNTDDKLWKQADWSRLESFFLQSTFRDLWRMFLEAGKLIPIDSRQKMMTYRPYFDCTLVSQGHLAVKSNQLGLFWPDKPSPTKKTSRLCH